MNIDQYLEAIIDREGGYINHPSDHGRATKFGITEAVARSNGYQGDMRDLPLAVAKSIYKQQYWFEPQFDQINKISPAIAEELLDTAINCGVNFAKPLLQRALNLLNKQGEEGWPNLALDGQYGPLTIQALSTYLNRRNKDGETVLLRVLNIMQGQHYIEITEKNPNYEDFFYGWILNRVAL
ncbi:glycoside hydrolase family 108 protein [Acinetobacter oleivorans]